MDLIPTPAQLASAAANVAFAALNGGSADPRPMPRTLISQTTMGELYSYDCPTVGNPILLVPPNRSVARAFDLRRGCSLVEHLIQSRPTYIVEYDGATDLRECVEHVIPDSVREVSADAAQRPVHVVGWSLGGILAALSTAAHKLPIASLSLVSTPIDLSGVPALAPARPLLDLSAVPTPVSAAYRLLGGSPIPFVGEFVANQAVQELIATPLAKLRRLDDREFLAQVEAVEQLSQQASPYSGREFGRLFHQVPAGVDLPGGAIRLGRRRVRLSAMEVPVLIVAGNVDTIAPMATIKPWTKVLSGSPEVQFEIVPGGHLGALTGRAAREDTWPSLVEWFDTNN